MRGTHRDKPNVCVRQRIIPAHAGNTASSGSPASRRRDHPRACGEHGNVCSFLRRTRGSSPRMRGTLFSVFWACRFVGIIPAHAGNTTVSAVVAGQARDHPRACGEHTLEPFRVSSDPGSSPRMRGTLEQGYRGLHLVGIIPAHAGNTITRQPAQRAERDHPRACGEHKSGTSFIQTVRGSSPRMRGTPGHFAM